VQAGGAANGSQAGAASTAPAADETATAGDRAGADAASGALSDAVTKSGAAATIVLPPSGAAGSPDSVGGKDAAGNGVLAGNAVRAADAATPPAAGSDSVGPGAAAAATVAARALASAATSPAAEGSQPPAFANGLNADGAGEPQINLALAEGSDATGATASALQAANAAASTPPAPPQALVMPSMIAQTIGDGSVGSPASASPAASPVSAALMSASDSTGLAGDSASHAHEGMGDGGAGLGANGGDGAAALQQLSAASASSSTDSPPPTLRVHAPVDSTDFPQGVADRVSFAVDNDWSSAKLQVTPPQLGPIDLQIAVQGDHAQVMMSTHSAVTREALESSLPKLKEMLGSQGFTQVSVDISQRSFQDRSAFNQPYTWTKGDSFSDAAAAAPVSAPSSAAARATVGVLDAYA
jgi:flagellar hook-length control protein FliK